MAGAAPSHELEHQKLHHDHLRERKQRHKWLLGEASPTRGHPSRRPNKPMKPSVVRLYRRQGRHDPQKRPSCPDPDASASDDEVDVQDAFKGTAPEAAYTYSYDCPNGASKGSQILGQAVAKAVEVYETKKTEKLLKDEYEIVENDNEEASAGSSVEEEDFELL